MRWNRIVALFVWPLWVYVIREGSNKVPLPSDVLQCYVTAFHALSPNFFLWDSVFSPKTQCPFTFIFTYITQHLIYSLSFLVPLLFIPLSAFCISLPNAKYYLLMCEISTDKCALRHFYHWWRETSQQPFNKYFYFLDIHLKLSLPLSFSVVVVLTFQHNPLLVKFCVFAQVITWVVTSQCVF